jgi:hypothetical protein
MTFIQQTIIQLATGAIAFIVGLMISRLQRLWAYFRSPIFWRPLFRRDLELVLGDGFKDLPKSFEASDVVGRGDLLASYELTTKISAVRIQRLQPSFADKMRDNDPGGAGLRKNLVILGGKDANSLTQHCVDRLRCSYDLIWPEEIQIEPSTRSDTALIEGAETQIPRLEPAQTFAESGRDGYNSSERESFEPIVNEHGIAVRDYGVIIRARNPFLSRNESNKRVVVIYGCFGFGTLAAAQYTQNQEFLDLVGNSDDDIECIVQCDVIDRAPQCLERVYFKSHPFGTLSPWRALTATPLGD